MFGPRDQCLEVAPTANGPRWIRLLTQRLPRCALLSEAGSGWKISRGSQWMRQQGVKT